MKIGSQMRNKWSALALALLALAQVAGGQVRAELQQSTAATAAPVELQQQQQENFPYFMQSPLQTQELRPISQRASMPSTAPVYEPVQVVKQASEAPPTTSCLYDKRHFARFEQCLERKPYPTIGLPAFRNDELLATGADKHDKRGCSFVLTNGLFKHYQVTKYALDTDTQCLDDNKQLQMSMQFNNVTLYYLWQLRCLNYANQLLEDATLAGRSASVNLQTSGSSTSQSGDANSICVGSSQNFGFSSLQVSQIEAQVELASDIYKNWRVTNITLSMLPAGGKLAPSNEPADLPNEHAHESHRSTGVRDFTFETLDGDELNWRYLHLYENWTRNRLHTNFLDQFKRFVWISLQRCLSEAGEKLPVKLVDLFGQHKYN